MRSSTVIVAILLGIAILCMLGNRLLPPIVDPIAKYIGEQRAGKAVVPEHQRR